MEPGSETSWRIRSAEDGDLAAILDLAGQALSTTTIEATSWIAQWWDSDAVGAFVADRDGRFAGFFMLGFLLGRDSSHLVGELLAIAVHPRAQRRGAGRRLIEHAARIVAEAEVDVAQRSLQLNVAQHNVAGLALFEASGFVPVEGVAAPYPDGSSSLRMSRLLPSTVSALEGSLAR